MKTTRVGSMVFSSFFVLLVSSAGALFAKTQDSLHAAVRAADSVAALGEADLRSILRDQNRDFLVVQVEDGTTLREGHDRVRREAEVLVPALDNVAGKRRRETAQLARELWRLGDAACQLALGYDTIDDRLLDQANDLVDRITVVRQKLRRLLPRHVQLFESLTTSHTLHEFGSLPDESGRFSGRLPSHVASPNT